MKCAFGRRLKASRSVLVESRYAISCLSGDSATMIMARHGAVCQSLPIKSFETRSNSHTPPQGKPWPYREGRQLADLGGQAQQRAATVR